MSENNKNSESKKTIRINTVSNDVYGLNNIGGNSKNKASNSRVSNDSKKVKQSPTTEKYVSSSEAIDKMLSLCKKFFVTGTIFIAATAIIVGGTIYFTGYDPIPIIEKHFIYASDTDDIQEDIVEMLPGLNTSKALISEDLFNDLYNFVSLDLAQVILDEELFRKGREDFNTKIAEFYSTQYQDAIVTDDVIYNALRDIYSTENRYPYSLTLTSVGKVMRDGKAVTKISVDINSVDDDLGFHVWNIALFLNNNKEIVDAKILAENKSLKNTRTPLSPSLSLITNGVDDSTIRTTKAFLKGMTNEALYNKIVASGKEFNQSQLKAFFSKLSLQDKDYEVLSEMFKVSKGVGSNFAITEVMATDFNGEPLTDIIISIKSNGNTYKYDLVYNRREKALVKVSTV